MSAIINKLIERCRAEGLRKTKALEALLLTLLETDCPMTLAELADSPRLVNQCDKATVFRLLQRLEGKGIIRKLGLHERAAYFELLLPDHHRDYLICTECGSIQPIKAACPVHSLQKEIQLTSGYSNLHHELEFYGTCPKCS